MRNTARTRVEELSRLTLACGTAAPVGTGAQALRGTAVRDTVHTRAKQSSSPLRTQPARGAAFTWGPPGAQLVRKVAEKSAIMQAVPLPSFTTNTADVRHGTRPAGFPSRETPA